ncbi:uncharacterized protein LOC130896576 [Diorhabda carinulata]|uniref:uncharacterized protein LOC130896576 n=1 Tax=Diorhabda carinulata TaxID=1163345 RepID=UPI0025A227B6|nr:uncharacterized protein LOC130896576 [Diorhabda carinulata]
MSGNRFCLIFIVLCSFGSYSEGVDASLGVLDIVKIAKIVAEGIAKAWNIVDQRVDFPELPIPILDRTEAKLFGKINVLSRKLDELAVKVDGVGTDTISTILRNLPDRVRLELRLNDLSNYMTRADVNFRNFLKYADRKNDFERLTLEDFARTAVSHDSNSIISLMERIDVFISPPSRGLAETGILELLLKDLGEIEGDTICNSKQSPQQVIFNLYNSIAITELKGYSMIQFSYMLLRLYNKGNFTTESQILRERFEERTNSAINVVKKVMGEASREYWKCDPKKYVKGETYEEITQLLQGYVQNEVDLNPDGTCRENCAEYTYTKSHGCFQNLYCRQQRRCNGKIIDCRYYDSDMWICPADPLSGRRYEYIEYENGRILGRKQECTRGTTKVDSWWRWLFWHCSYCFCLCDEQGSNSDRYVNMRPVISNISNNMVVVGLRFVKKNRIIHVQIQEGKLLPRGNIDQSSVRWVPVEDYRITDRKIYSGQDYHTFSWEKRAIDLDDLEADEGYVVTGIRFKEIGSHLNFEIYTSKFDFVTGTLINPTSTSIWKDNANTDSSTKNPRRKIWLVSPDIPTRTTSPSIPTSTPDSYIELTHTDIDRDVAQTTVPFWDSQKVESLQAVPLSGAGIFHKGRKFFGGFIALKMFTYDFSKHLEAAFPEEEISCICDTTEKAMTIFLGITIILTLVKYSVNLDTGTLLVDSLRKDFFVLEDQLWQYIFKERKDDFVDPGIEILKKFNEFDVKIRELPQDILYGMTVQKKSELFLLFFSDVRVIQDLYEKFHRYQIHLLSPTKKDYSDYGKDISISSLVNDILHDPKNNVNQISLQINNQSLNLIGKMIYEMVDNFNCEYPTQSRQQVIYNLYNLIASTELKGYVMTQFALMASRLQEKGNYSKISIEVRKEFNNRMKEVYRLTKILMTSLSTTIYRCDPKYHSEGKTYDQLTRLVQAHIQNEVDLNPTRTCKETCGEYSSTTSQGCYDSGSDYCKYSKPCKGNIYNCEFIESHMTTCISSNLSPRRYEYIKLHSGTVLGHENRCSAKDVYSWTRWFVHCSTCLCYCDEQGALSDRYFNLRPATADVQKNRVVTGLRLIKLDRIFHVQIQEGRLLPHGYIDQTTVKWVPVKRYRIFDMGVKNGVDYHTMDYGHRRVYLNTLIDEKSNYIVTGARFALNNGNLQFQITVTRFDFNTGKLYANESYEADRKEFISMERINIDQPDIPTNSPPSEPVIGWNQFLDFTATDLIKDAAQTTIPFVDIQPVSAEPAVPLKSAGLYYKGHVGYGGFIGIVADTYDYSKHLKFEFPLARNREESEENYEVMPN